MRTEERCNISENMLIQTNATKTKHYPVIFTMLALLTLH